MLNNLGLAYRHTGNSSKARLTYEESLAIPNIKQNPGLEGVLHNNLAMTYLDMGSTDKAIQHLKAALPLRRQARDIRGTAETLQNLVELCNQAGDSTGAAQYTKQLQDLM
ncbi:MAG: tetratricopeptide repeat protein [Anaerolineaceae bacterium]|nr:tetratricopeptide repeat protein [Anaerolineaceae bacterium]